MNNIMWRSKFTLVITLFILLSVYLIANFLINSGWCIENCSYEFKNYTIDPTIIYLQFLIPVLGTFILLPANLFKKLFIYILSWYLPLSLILIISEPTYTTGGVIGLSGRKFMAGLTGIGLVAVTIVFLISILAYKLYKKLKQNK